MSRRHGPGKSGQASNFTIMLLLETTVWLTFTCVIIIATVFVRSHETKATCLGCNTHAPTNQTQHCIHVNLRPPFRLL